MRYPPEHRKATHRKVVHVASRRFRREGIDAVGVASVMKDAGLTHGGFYGHFASKEALVAEAARAAFEEMVPHYRDRMDEAPPGGKLQALVRSYLSPLHRDNAAQGCPLAALATEIARQPAPVRDAATEGLEHLLSAIRDACKADGLPLEPEAVLACLVGALALSRVPTDASRSARYLDQTLRMIDALAEAHRSEPASAPAAANRPRRPAGTRPHR